MDLTRVTFNPTSLPRERFAEWLGADASKERLLLVLDTFEEAQVLGDEAVDRVAAFLTAVQKRVPDIRVIIVGRDEATGWFADAERMRLTELKDQASRRAFLEVRGVPRSLSAEVAKTAGGRPLALLLAARLVNEHGIEAIKLSIGDRFKGLFNERLIEGILYDRTLDHIKDKDVRALTHPGLVLRRLNGEIIQEVIVPVLGLVGFDPEKIARVMEMPWYHRKYCCG